ncbi:MAG: hypothetical protein ACLFR2_09780 [Candidatus Kapaibacterium sp.]
MGEKDIKSEDLVNIYGPEERKAKKELLVKLKKLWNEKDFKTILEICEKEYRAIPQKPKGKGDKDISAINLIYATALFEESDNNDLAKQTAIRAIHFDRENTPAMWLVRKINDRVSDSANYYQIEVEGRYMAPLKDGVREETFLTLYGVIADDPDDAMDYIKEIERPEIKDKIMLKKHRVLEAKPDNKKGVYATRGLMAVGPE